MAVANSLVKAQAKPVQIEIQANGETVKISPNMVRSMLVNGNGAVTDQEVNMFISLCKFSHLNPFLKEAYLIKYGNSPATMVVGKDVLLKRAMRSDKYEGHLAGVIVVNTASQIEEREGTFVLDGENLVGGWAKVYIKGYSTPIYASVSMKEYSTGKSNWQTKPATMIRKVALAQALREAFPEEMSALYDASEMDKTVVETTGQEIVLNETPIEVPTQNAVETPVQVVEAEKVITPVQTAAKPSEATQGGQTAIDDIMFNDNVADLMNQPPFEI